LDITESGIYWVEITEGVCVVRDSVEITYFDIENFLGVDTSMCMGDRIRLSYDDDGLSAYEWSNGSNGSSIEVREGGTYSLKLTRSGCEVLDELVVTEKPQPTLSIDKEISVCDGESILLRPTSNGDRYEWSNGELNKEISVSEEGTYQVIAYLEDCPANDFTTVFVDERPEFNFEPDSTI